MSGGMVAMSLAHYTSWTLPWEPLTLAFTLGAIWLTVRGVRLSTTVVGLAVLMQVTIMVIVCVVVIVDQRAHLSGIPFSWGHLTGGLAGLSAGFPLALYMFIDGRTAQHLPRSVETRGGPSQEHCSYRSRLAPPSLSSSPMRQSLASITTSPPLGAHRSRS
jgi:hypothetical protein